MSNRSEPISPQPKFCPFLKKDCIGDKCALWVGRTVQQIDTITRLKTLVTKHFCVFVALLIYALTKDGMVAKEEENSDQGRNKNGKGVKDTLFCMWASSKKKGVEAPSENGTQHNE